MIIEGSGPVPREVSHAKYLWHHMYEIRKNGKTTYGFESDTLPGLRLRARTPELLGYWVATHGFQLKMLGAEWDAPLAACTSTYPDEDLKREEGEKFVSSYYTSFGAFAAAAVKYARIMRDPNRSVRDLNKLGFP